MQNSIGFTPIQGNHINSLELCGAFHTLITESVDNSGIPTGVNFVELNTFTDPDFNKQGLEGTGIDIIHFYVPLNGYTGSLSLHTKGYYQPLPAKFTGAVFAYSSTEIDLFKGMYNSADHTPVIVAQASINWTVGINEIKRGNLIIKR